LAKKTPAKYGGITPELMKSRHAARHVPKVGMITALWEPHHQHVKSNWTK